MKICKALDGLEGFGGFRNAFGGFGKLSCKHSMSLTGFVDQSCCPTNPDLADILGRTDLNFENFYFFHFSR